ncbi:MAG: glutamine-hydrolyzing carbamoyl-phosphate synthase small subunit [Deltaproteobacteria bacterium]|nr:glutamine-hydrolyzing carbamoyl-phosphate synthase small subunit [Deltaproteobacteria bacterium]NIS76965.1 glutamine-hydrolyzing carbamoyl-phosphate synthase small subunit [Deltaproteobacteria bacterium]
MKGAYLALENGSFFEGFSFGAAGETSGEVIFNTGMTGYQEILTDPSYRGQIVLMTYPQIGNYGVNDEDVESVRPWVEGFIVREYWDEPSNWRSRESLGSYLSRHGIVGIWGIDTRMITRMIREEGAMRGFISTEISERGTLVEKARNAEKIEGRDLVQQVTCREPYEWIHGDWDILKGYGKAEEYRQKFKKIPHVGVIDCGVKLNILRQLVSHGFRVTVFPAHTHFDTLHGEKLDALFISNGPGDPMGVPYVVETVRRSLGKLPIFGICLGHQILGLALGGRTYKLKFGHHGVNQPTLDLETGKVQITSQNHNFSVDASSIEERAKITHINLNDKTVEALAIPDLNVFSVQYHPEASPGPHDSRYIFNRFYEHMESMWS